jgi:hypothetical protein
VISRTRASALALEEELFELIKAKSAIRACRAKDKYLARILKRPVSTVRNALKRLQQKGLVLIPYPEFNPNTATSQRTIYVYSKEVLDGGALLLANLARSRGKTTRLTDNEGCGQLLCTPEQFRSWRSRAVELEYITVGYRDGTRVITRQAPSISWIELPNAGKNFEYIQPTSPFMRVDISLKDAIVELIKEEWQGQTRMTNARIAERLHARQIPASATSIARAIDVLEKEQRIFRQPAGHDRVLSLRPFTSSEDGAWTPVIALRSRLDGVPVDASGKALAKLVGTFRARACTEAARELINNGQAHLFKVGRKRFISTTPFTDEFKAEQAMLHAQAARLLYNGDRAERRRTKRIQAKKASAIDLVRQVVQVKLAAYPNLPPLEVTDDVVQEAMEVAGRLDKRPEADRISAVANVIVNRHYDAHLARLTISTSCIAPMTLTSTSLSPSSTNLLPLSLSRSTSFLAWKSSAPSCVTAESSVAALSASK